MMSVCLMQGSCRPGVKLMNRYTRVNVSDVPIILAAFILRVYLRRCWLRAG